MSQNNAIIVLKPKSVIRNKIANVNCVVIERKLFIGISECSKLAHKEYKTRYDSAWKVIHRELCKTLKFDHTFKSCLLKQGSVWGNETHTILWDVEIQTDPLIPTRRPNLVITKKQKRESVVFCRPSRPQNENQRKGEKISIWTLQENEESCRIWGWEWKQL